MHFGFTLELSATDLRNIDLLDTHLDLLSPDKYTDIHNKYFVCLHNMSPYHMSSRCLQDMSSRHLQDIFKTCLQESSRHLQDMSLRRLQDQQMFAGNEI